MRLGAKDIELIPGSLISCLYDNAASKRLRFRHRYEVDPKYLGILGEHGMIFSWHHPTQRIMQMLELPESMHPYFVGTQAHPCLTSRPISPDGMFLGLVKAALARAYPQGTLDGVAGVSGAVGGPGGPKNSGDPQPSVGVSAVAMAAADFAMTGQ